MMQALQSGWDFFQNEVLGMKWLNRLIGSAVEACGLDPAGKVGGSLQFFFYDVIKIMVLLGVLILLISYIQSYFPPERTKKILGRFHGIIANCIAALLGTVTPFCSCSSIPLFIGFTSAGLPLGVTFSFLISCSDGGSGQPGAADEHFRLESRHCLCGAGAGHRRGRRNSDRETALGGTGGGIYPNRPCHRCSPGGTAFQGSDAVRLGAGGIHS